MTEIFASSNGNRRAWPEWVRRINEEADLQTGIWTLQGSYGVEGGAFYPIPPHDMLFFSPEALSGQGIR